MTAIRIAIKISLTKYQPFHSNTIQHNSPLFRSSMIACKIRKKVQERRLKWYAHVMRREEHYVGRRAMEMKVQGRREKRRWLDKVKDDIKEQGLSADDA